MDKQEEIDDIQKKSAVALWRDYCDQKERIAELVGVITLLVDRNGWVTKEQLRRLNRIVKEHRKGE